MVLGFCAIAVFGTSVTGALQHLRSWDEAAFEGWYAPWQAELKADPLCRFFHKMRTDIIHGGVPNIAYVLHAAGVNPAMVRSTEIANFGINPAERQYRRVGTYRSSHTHKGHGISRGRGLFLYHYPIILNPRRCPYLRSRDAQQSVITITQICASHHGPKNQDGLQEKCKIETTTPRAKARPVGRARP